MGFPTVIPRFMADAVRLHCGLAASGLDLLFIACYTLHCPDSPSSVSSELLQLGQDLENNEPYYFLLLLFGDIWSASLHENYPIF